MNVVEEFRAMGCSVVVAGTGSDREAVQMLFERWEAVFSRFRANSELCRVNAAAGKPVVVSELFAEAVRSALEARSFSEGLVDPTLAKALAHAGYDRDLDLLDRDDPRRAGPAAPGRGSDLLFTGRALLVPEDVAIDLAGVVKGMAVDAAVALLSTPGWISAGGDVATRGPLEVALPGGSGSVRLEAGALATSGTAHRRWRRGGVLNHHLIDPRSGRPADSPWEQVTVCGKSCLAADVAAKTAFLRGADGPDWLDSRGLPGRFLRAGGGIVENRTWRRALSAAA
jgi:thiamine biosynthesis lipoprotein